MNGVEIRLLEARADTVLIKRQQFRCVLHLAGAAFTLQLPLSFKALGFISDAEEVVGQMLFLYLLLHSQYIR